MSWQVVPFNTGLIVAHSAGIVRIDQQSVNGVVHFLQHDRLAVVGKPTDEVLNVERQTVHRISNAGNHDFRLNDVQLLTTQQASGEAHRVFAGQGGEVYEQHIVGGSVAVTSALQRA